MQRFARLFEALDASPATSAKLAALQAYLREAPPQDAAWAVYVLAGGRPRLSVPVGVLRATAARVAGLPDWLFEASHAAVGDLAETIAHVLPPPSRRSDRPLSAWITGPLAALRGLDPVAQGEALAAAWDELDPRERFVMVKLIGGGWRVGVSRLLVQRVLAAHAGLPPALIAQRMMGWTRPGHAPDAAALQALLAPPPPEDGGPRTDGQPWPFCLAHPHEGEVTALGPREAWQAEWKFDGIRAQAVRRGDGLWLWSRGEELVDEAFPDVLQALRGLPPGTVLDGELLVWPEGAPRPAPFATLQTRLGRRAPPKRLLAQSPVVFVAWDLPEHGGRDRRADPLHERRAALEALWREQAAQAAAAGAPPPWRLSPVLTPAQAPDWDALAAHRAGARTRGTEGLMLKPLDGPYAAGRTRGPGGWLKWKLDPLSLDLVLVHAQAGHGRRAGLHTDYGFAVWNRPPRDEAEAQAVAEAIARREPPDPQGLQLLPLAKAYGGLTDAEFAAVDRIVRATTVQRFGPVRAVRPTQVFEIGFEGVQRSPRHRSGLALRFPRMLRWRTDKPWWQADDLASVESLRQWLDGDADPAGPGEPPPP
jgi:DNA ligase-1